MRLIAYLRVSSESQLEGYGLDSQQSAVTAWAKRHEHHLVRVVSDVGISGATDALDRPGLAEALQAIVEGRVDGLVVARLDRLARALTVQEATLGIVWRAGGQVLTVDQGQVLRDDPDDPMRTALRQVVGVFSELERRLVTKRLKDGRSAKAATGRKAVGSYAFGYRGEGQGRERDAVQDEVEGATVHRIIGLRNSDMSYRAIAEALNQEGLRSKRGSIWHPMTVRNVVLRAADHCASTAAED
jgi:DNA invertase Pin-like site-specific DNA recombinase